MALDSIAGAAYHEPMNTIQRSDAPMSDVNQQNSGINITDSATAISTTNGTQTDSEQNGKTPTDKQIKDAINRANNTMKAHRTRCEFAYHDETKRISIKVIDEDTKKVVREIPPEETLKMVEKMWEIAGILVDEKR